MIDKIKLFLERFSEFPREIFPPELSGPPYVRAYTFAINISLISVFAHVIFILLFAYLSVNILAIFNIFSVIIWILAIFILRRGYPWQSYVIRAIEIIAHTSLCVVIIGWDAGFQYYIFVHPIVMFLSPWRFSAKALIAIIFTFAYIAMAHYASISSPYVELSPFSLAALNYMNIVNAIIFPIVGTYGYYITTIRVENKLNKEHEKTNHALSERNELLSKLNSELTEAADYVKTILPQPLSNEFVQIDWRFIPSTSLGGDAFGYHMVDDDHLAIYLIDVSGHGVGAALLSVSVVNVLRSHSLPKTDFRQPDQVLKALNLAFPSESNKDMFFTIWYGVYNKNSRELSYASAGHPPAILCDEDSSCNCRFNLLKTPNFVVGGIKGTNYVKDTCKVPEGNKLYIFSDGVYEVEKSDGTNWHFNEFLNYIKKVKTDGQAIMDRLYDYVRRKGKSDNIEDDFTIVEIVFG